MRLGDLFRGHSGLSGQSMLGLTEQGKSCVDKMYVNGKASRAIMYSLDEHSPQSLSSITKDSGLSFHEVKKKAVQLGRQGYIQQTDATPSMSQQMPQSEVI